MTILTPPTWLENSAAHNAQDYRTMLASIIAGRSGSTDVDAFEVTERAGTPNMSVDVAAGGIFVASTRSSSAGAYHVYNDGVVNVPLSAADATNPRIDRVLVQVRDEEQDAALTQNDARILVVEGTPAGSPSLPAITVEDYVELAQVTVPASASSITDANIDDVREFIELDNAKVGRRLVYLETELNTGFTSSEVTANGLTTSPVVLDESRNVTVDCEVSVECSAAPQVIYLKLQERVNGGSWTTLIQRELTVVSPSVEIPGRLGRSGVKAAGSYEWRLRVWRGGASGSGLLDHDSSTPGWIKAIDEGAA